MEAFICVNGGTLPAIQQLQSVLDKNYLSAEKIMSLRNPDHETLKALLNDIDSTYRVLIEAMAFSNVGSEAIVAVTQNQHEFKCRSEDWFSKQGQSTSGITTAISGDKEPLKSTGTYLLLLIILLSCLLRYLLNLLVDLLNLHVVLQDLVLNKWRLKQS